MKTLTDDMLVASYTQGNNEAFDELLARHQARIYSYILMMVKNEDVADDIFQDTFVKVVTTLKQGRYTDTGRFAAWLTRVARNLVIDYFRQEKARASYPPTTAISTSSTAANSATAPSRTSSSTCRFRTTCAISCAISPRISAACSSCATTRTSPSRRLPLPRA